MKNIVNSQTEFLTFPARKVLLQFCPWKKAIARLKTPSIPSEAKTLPNTSQTKLVNIKWTWRCKHFSKISIIFYIHCLIIFEVFNPSKLRVLVKIYNKMDVHNFNSISIPLFVSHSELFNFTSSILNFTSSMYKTYTKTDVLKVVQNTKV